MNCFLFVLVDAILLAISADASFYHKEGIIKPPINSTLQGKLKDSTKWFTQKLDHFSSSNRATWQQRYFVNDEFFDKKSKNVAFIKVGEETAINEFWMANGDWVENAIKFKAILFNLEHRYYGKSRPTKDLSVENLKYLTIEQTLEDLATFITAMNKQYTLSPNVTWVAFGGFYSGELAAWARLKYPNLIRGAVSSSAPILKVLNYGGYFQVVADDLRNVNQKCYDAVQKAFAQVDALLKNKVGQKTLTSKFELCEPLEENVGDLRKVASYYNLLANNFGVTAQYNNINGENDISLDQACAIMTSFKVTKEIDRLASFNRLLNEAFGQECTDFNYSPWIAQLRNTAWGETGSKSSMELSNVPEIGRFQTSDGQPQIFSNKFPLRYNIMQCTDIFGPEFNRSRIESGINRINSLYGGSNLNVTNVAFVHGSLDPFYKLGITKTVNPKAPVIFIKGTAQAADMYPPAEGDLPQLKAARIQITKLIQTWLNL